MQFTLTINCTGAAFADDGNPANPDATFCRDNELARILSSISGSLQDGQISAGTILDTNGNPCGSYAFREPETLDEMLARHQRELAELAPVFPPMDASGNILP